MSQFFLFNTQIAKPDKQLSSTPGSHAASHTTPLSALTSHPSSLASSLSSSGMSSSSGLHSQMGLSSHSAPSHPSQSLGSSRQVRKKGEKEQNSLFFKIKRLSYETSNFDKEYLFDFIVHYVLLSEQSNTIYYFVQKIAHFYRIKEI